MSRLIDADDIVYESIDSSDTSRHERYYGTGIVAVRKEDIDAMPTIEEREPGRWVRTGRTNVFGGFEVECSNCHDTVMITHLEDELFCRHCGAKMEVDDG